ncbi:MAG: hypothetical protein K2L03_00075, partial [Bacteroidales bacterium]|nr:hypothetical protein [Bacteroidales bacterium]
GKDIAAGTVLNDYFFSAAFSTEGFTPSQTVRSESVTKISPILTDDFTDGNFAFLEHPVTGFFLSALGGVYFTDAKNLQATDEMTLPTSAATKLSARAVLTKDTTGIEKWTDEYGQEQEESVIMDGIPCEVTKIAGIPAAYLVLHVDAATLAPEILVQYNYQTGADTLLYQIKVTALGRMECHILKQTISEPASYKFSLALNREEGESLNIAGGNQYEANTYFPYWVCNPYLLLEGRCIAAYAKNGEITGTSEAIGAINATVTLSETAKSLLTEAKGIIVLASTEAGPSPKFENKTYQVGDLIKQAESDQPTYPVVFAGQPQDPANFTFTAEDLVPGKDYYLYAYLYSECTALGQPTIYYAEDALVFSEAIKTKTMTPPTGLQAGAWNGDKVTLSFTADPNFKAIILKTENANMALDLNGTYEVGDEATKTTTDFAQTTVT